MPREALNVHIDLVALQAVFFRRLQRQLDVTKILQVGCDVVTAEQISNAQEFGAFVPANGAQLPHDRAKSEAHDWLLSGFLRDVVTGSGLVVTGQVLHQRIPHPNTAGSENSTKMVSDTIASSGWLCPQIFCTMPLLHDRSSAWLRDKSTSPS